MLTAILNSVSALGVAVWNLIKLTVFFFVNFYN